ncbi:MAG: hypothetical protein ACI837_000828 [Crocinitomicaceae bacterium]|jgi:hypothetical protein
MKNLLYIVCLSCLAFSCTIQQKIHFNRDWSGTMEYQVDLSSMKEMMESTADSTDSGDFMNDPEMLAALDKMKSVEGISNVKYVESDEDVLSYSYDFSSIDALNRSFGAGSIMEMGGENNPSSSFILKGNKLTYQLAAVESPLEEEEEGEGIGLEMINYELTISFDREIKKVTGEGTQISNGNTMELHTNFSELMKLAGESQKIVMKLGK